MPGISTRISAFFGNSSANLNMSNFYSAKNELKKADKYCRRAESIISKDLKKAYNSSTSFDIAKTNKLHDLDKQAISCRKHLDKRLDALKPSGIDNNKATVQTKSSSVSGEQKRLTPEELNQQATTIKDLAKSPEHIKFIKDNMIKLCDKIVRTQNLEDGQARRVVTGLKNLKHLDTNPPHPVDSCTALLAEKFDGVTFKDLGNEDFLTQDQKQAIINFLPRIKTFVESSC